MNHLKVKFKKNQIFKNLTKQLNRINSHLIVYKNNNKNFNKIYILLKKILIQEFKITKKIL